MWRSPPSRDAPYPHSVTAIRAEATRWVDDDQPGWVEIIIVDADGVRWVVVEKVPVLGDDSLTPEATYPRPTLVPCNAEPGDEDGRVVVTLLHDIEAEGGQTRFVVEPSKVVRG